MKYPQEDRDGFFVWGNLLLHLESKLIWAINSKIVSLKLPDANQYCRDLNLDGFDDWTMPTASEMQAVLAKQTIYIQKNFSFWTTSGTTRPGSNLEASFLVWPVSHGVSSTLGYANFESLIRDFGYRFKYLGDAGYSRIVKTYESIHRVELVDESIENKRKEIASELTAIRRSNYEKTSNFYSAKCTDFIPLRQFEKDNTEFVQGWMAERNITPDDEQCLSISEVWSNVQVVARAGSGKTATMVNKAFFLQQHCKMPPNQILLLAFNKRAVTELEERLSKLLNGNVPHVMTFHSLAYAIVHPEAILCDAQDGEAMALSRVFQQIIDQFLQNPEIEKEIRRLMLLRFSEDWDKISEGGFNLNRDEMLLYRRSLRRESLGGDFVKSYGEKVIADFLFEHDIPYKYERNYIWNNTNYRPDFTLFSTKKSGVVIEYFGLSGDTDYDAMSEKKRQYWRGQEAWSFLEYFPHDIKGKEKEFRSRITRDLEALGFSCKKLSEDEVWERLKERRAIDNFTGAIRSFILKCRKNWITPEALQALTMTYSPIAETERLFHNVALRIYKSYVDRIEAVGEDDFDGLMQSAALRVDGGYTKFNKRKSSGDLKDLRFILIDEFQDFSEHFYRLVFAVKKINPEVKFFCVGDDWQAINGFAGSNLRFYSDFPQYFERSKKHYISTNYRSSRQIVEAGNALMVGLGSPAKVKKASLGEVLVADIASLSPTLTEKERHRADKISPAIVRLVKQALGQGHSVVLLTRTNRVPYSVFDITKDSSENTIESFLASIRSYFPEPLRTQITCSTVHKYKGLQKQCVIILDALASCYPLLHPDWIFGRILGDDLNKIIQEERRLFYVAITRAVDKVIFVTEGDSTSPFFEELKTRVTVNKVYWADIPPVETSLQSGVVVVKISSQSNLGSSPTFAIKDLLKTSGYSWDGTGSKSWVKGYPSDSFSLEAIQSEVWAPRANGIQIHLVGETQTRCFNVDNSKWEEVSA